jgi:NADH-quinone oxidoreductase subunit M
MSPLLLLILLPIVSSAFIIVGSPARKTALITAALNVLAFLLIAGTYDLAKGGHQFLSSLPILPDLGIAFTLGADGFSLAMLGLSVVVTLAAVAVARTPDKMPGSFYASLLLISAGAIGAFASVDVFFFYMFHELALVPTFLLIGIWGSGDRQAAAWKVTIYLALGSFILLLGLIGLYLSMPAGARTFDMREIASLAAIGAFVPHDAVFLLLFFGFGILVALFPFHTWAPQAYASAPSPAAMLHAGVLKKFGLYGMLRLLTPVFPAYMVERWAWLLLVLVAGNILYVGFVTISQRKLDLMLGHSSVMHMGYAFLGIIAWNTLGTNGAAYTLIAHGLTIAALFALCGELRERTGTLDFSELGGLAKTMPAFGLLFGFAAMASIGLPGFAGFAAEVMVFFGAFSGGPAGAPAFNIWQITTIIAVWGVVISAVYMLRAYRKIFLGEATGRWSVLPEIGWVTRLSVSVLLILLLIAGFWPPLLLQYLSPSLLVP